MTLIKITYVSAHYGIIQYHIIIMQHNMIFLYCKAIIRNIFINKWVTQTQKNFHRFFVVRRHWDKRITIN